MILCDDDFAHRSTAGSYREFFFRQLAVSLLFGLPHLIGMDLFVFAHDFLPSRVRVLSGRVHLEFLFLPPILVAGEQIRVTGAPISRATLPYSVPISNALGLTAR